jgi:biotin operon repressor
MVSDDGYELPMVVADSAGELARMLGITEATIYHQISNARKHGYFCRYVKVRVEL